MLKLLAMKNTSLVVSIIAVSLGFLGISYASVDRANPAKKEVPSPPTVTLSNNSITIRAGEAVLTFGHYPSDNKKFLTVEQEARYEKAIQVVTSTPNGFWPFLHGDILKQINDTPIVHPNDVMFVFRNAAGSTFNFEVIRNDKGIKFKAGPKDFAGLALPPTSEPPVPPTPPSTK